MWPIPSNFAPGSSFLSSLHLIFSLTKLLHIVLFLCLCSLFRYSLALLDVGNLKSSYIRGNSFRDGFNTAIGVFGTNELAVVDNVIHYTVGSAVRVWGRNNKVLHNLAVLSVSPGIMFMCIHLFESPYFSGLICLNCRSNVII